MFHSKFKNQKGVSIFLALMILTIFLAIAFGLSRILLSEIKTIREISFSVNAFFAADTGIEQIFYLNRVCNTPGCTHTACESGCDGITSGYLIDYGEGETIDTGGDYKVGWSSNPDMASSTGRYEGMQRSIKAHY